MVHKQIITAPEPAFVSKPTEPSGSRDARPVHSCRDMIPALADQCDVPDMQFERVQLPYPRDERVELGGRNVVDTATLLAYEMSVCAREMKERRAVRLVHVFDESPIVQRVKCPVHGRQMNLWMSGVNARREVIGSEVFIRAREEFDHEPARGCDPPSRGAQRVEGSSFLFAHASQSPS